MNLTPHFTLEELTHSQDSVRLGIENTPSPEAIRNLERLAETLELVRSLLGDKPILISSGYRSPEINARVGGAPTSQHTKGLAVDFTCPAYGTPRLICGVINRSGINFDQLIFEGSWVHLSIAAAVDKPRGEVLSAVFKPGEPTRYLKGLA
ncbi:MAG: peptidase M15 [Nitrosomonadales bacterium]|nr:peptidase M15 [Nitrosomonadales bacterium]